MSYTDKMTNFEDLVWCYRQNTKSHLDQGNEAFKKGDLETSGNHATAVRIWELVVRDIEKVLENKNKRALEDSLEKGI